MLNMKNLDRFLSLVENAKRIVITTHLYPDADGIGSQIAMAIALSQLKKEVYCVNQEKLLDRYKYLDPDGVIICHNEYEKLVKSKQHFTTDLAIVMDTSSLNRVGPHVHDLINTSKNLLFIDHHPAAKEITSLHCIDFEKAATGELVAILIEALGITFTRDIALPLYTAILIDTNSFRYPSVSGDTHRVIAKLMDTGIRPSVEYNNVYGAKKTNQLHLLGTLLSTAQTTADEKIGWLVISEEIINRYNIHPEDTHAFVNHLLILDNIKVACMFRENGKFVKMSLRSDGDVDVGAIAQALGGGGHNHSAATVVEGDLNTVVQEMIAKIELILTDYEKETDQK